MSGLLKVWNRAFAISRELILCIDNDQCVHILRGCDTAFYSFPAAGPIQFLLK
jgi:hypothetical protein